MNTKKIIQYPPQNSYWVIPNQLLAGEYPGAKTQEEARTKLIGYLDAGVNAFLDLTEPHELNHYENDLKAIAQAKHIECLYQRMPIKDVSVPESKEVMTEILSTIQRWMVAGRCIYVHCWGGVGRTGTVVGCHLVNQGSSGAQALRTIATWWSTMSESKRKRRPTSPETPEQMAYIREWRSPHIE